MENNIENKHNQIEMHTAFALLFEINSQQTILFN